MGVEYIFITLFLTLTCTVSDMSIEFQFRSHVIFSPFHYLFSILMTLHEIESMKTECFDHQGIIRFIAFYTGPDPDSLDCHSCILLFLGHGKMECSFLFISERQFDILLKCDFVFFYQGEAITVSIKNRYQHP